MRSDRLLSDLRFAARALLAAPGFTVMAVLTLAIAIGANTAFFSVLQAVILKPLPYRQPDRLVTILGLSRERGFEAEALSWAKYQAYRQHTDLFAEMAAYAPDGFTVTDGRGDPDHVPGLHASANLLPLLGLELARGRHFTPEEDSGQGPPVAMISAHLWRTRFSSDPTVLGRTVRMNGLARTIVGVLPERMPVPFSEVGVIVPQPDNLPFVNAANQQHFVIYTCLAILAPGVSVDEATRRLAAMAEAFRLGHPLHLDANHTNEPRLLRDQVVGKLRQPFWILAAAVGVVLLIACANLANLLLARVSARQKEIAIRLSLGARPVEIVRQFLTEGLLCAALAGVLGVLLAWWSLPVIQALAGPQLPRAGEIQLDAGVLCFALLAVMVAGVLVGLYPAWQAARTDLLVVLKDANRGTINVRGSRGFRQVLVTAQLALSLTLLLTAGLCTVSFQRLRTTELGIEVAGRAFGAINLPDVRYPEEEQGRAFYRRLEEKLAAAPEFVAAGAANDLPLLGSGVFFPYAVEGRRVLPVQERPLARLRLVTPGYFRAMGMQLRSGRGITDADRFGAEAVAVINESFARRLFPGESALNRILLRGPEADVRLRIVGVVRDVRALGPAEPPPDEIYLASDQRGRDFMQVVAQVRPGLPAAAAIPVLRRLVAELDPELALAGPRTLEQLAQESIGVPRLTAALLLAYSGIAALLAAVGVYSVMSCAVAQRTSEIGVRLALGATAPDILRSIAGAAMIQLACGLVLGLAGAAGAAVLLRQALFDVRPFEPALYAVVVIGFALFAAAACLVPARRATRLDPLVALRAE